MRSRRPGRASQLECDNVGKPIEYAKEEIPAVVDCIRFFAGAVRNMEGKPAGEYMEGYTSMIRREAIGVVGQIAPWNYPLMMAAWKIGPALAAGNTIVLKPSEFTPVTSALLAEVVSSLFRTASSTSSSATAIPSASTWSATRTSRWFR